MSARTVAGLALAAGVALALGTSLAFWPFTIDDTFITARYAVNLAEGHGPVYNVGERVEGYSCPSWMGLLALADLAGLDPVLAAKVLGVVAAVLVVGVTFLALARAGVPHWGVAAATLWTASLTGLGVYGASGMETVPFALAVLLVAATPHLGLSCRARAVLAGVSLVLVATLRPEGALVAAGAGALWLRSDPSRRVKMAVVAAAIALAGLLAFRVAYYGSWVPNTFYAKPSPVLAALREAGVVSGGVQLLGAALAGPGVRALAGAAGGPLAVVLAAVALVRSGRDYRLRAGAIAVAAGWAFVVYAPPDWMPADRFAVPFVPALVLLAALGLRHVSSTGRALAIAVCAVTLAWVSWQVSALVELRRAYAHETVNPALDARAFAPIGEWLDRHATPGARLLAYEVGAVGYLSPCHLIDHEGLVTPAVARIVREAGGYTRIRFGGAPEALRRIVDVCVAQRPEWFLVRSSRPFPIAPGRPLPAGAANEPIQNALLDAFGPTMVLRAAFDLPAPPGVTERYLLLGRAGP